MIIWSGGSPRGQRRARAGILIAFDILRAMGNKSLCDSQQNVKSIKMRRGPRTREQRGADSFD